MTHLRNLAARFNVFNVRERILLVAVLIAVFYALAELFWLNPLGAEAKRLQARIKTEAIEQAALATAVAQLSAKPGSVPSADAGKQERDELMASIEEADRIVAQASKELRPGDVIRTLSASAAGVRLVSLKTLPSQLFFDPQVAAPAKSAASPTSAASAAPAPVPAAALLPRLYRHRIEVAVKGPYPGVAAYVQALERSISGVFWESLRIEAKYPETTARFTLSVLSTHPELVLE
jgi:hypothetical protein